jgi:hypothetical protein
MKYSAQGELVQAGAYYATVSAEHAYPDEESALRHARAIQEVVEASSELALREREYMLADQENRLPGDGRGPYLEIIKKAERRLQRATYAIGRVEKALEER